MVVKAKAETKASEQFPPLNELQLRTLRWVADGCPSGVFAGSAHRVSARALQRRRLVKITRRDGRWAAAITEWGRRSLDYGDDRPRTPALAAPRPSREHPAAPGNHAAEPERASDGPAPTRRTGPTDAMIAALLQANHRLEIPLAEADRYERLARSAMRHKKVPASTRVRVERRWPERTAWVLLEDLPNWMTATLEPVAIPAALRQPTDVVTALRSRDDLRIDRGQRQRALRIVEALVRAARRRGYAVRATPAPVTDRWGYVQRQPGEDGHLVVTIGPDAYRLSLEQERAKVAHVLTKAEEAQAARRHGAFVPRYDTVVTPHLRLRIEGNEAPFWRSTWSDRHGPALETALAQILQELELRHERAEQARVDAVRERERRTRAWEAARAAAIEQLVHAHRARVLREQVERWELAGQIRAFADAVAALLEASDPSAREQTGSWLAWVRAYADEIDPLSVPVAMPPDPTATEEALAPFMTGWNPYGPH